jgi:LacI family transcriptional regulator
MVRSRVTQADVARKAGVSTTAVSLVMNGRVGTRLSAEATERIRNAAAELDYRPNLTARALITQRSQIIGFISDGVTTGRFGNDLIRGALEEAESRGHVLFIAETGGNERSVVSAVDALVDRQADGIIFASTHPDRLPETGQHSGTPIVMLNAVGGSGAPVVLADEFTGARQIVDLLLESSGATEIAVIGRTYEDRISPAVNTGVQRRLRGIWDSLESHDIQAKWQIVCDDWSLEDGYNSMNTLLAAGHQPDGLICLNDRIAFGAYRALNEHGLRVPDDVSIVSFDDDDIAVYLEPKLSTAGFPYQEMGALAVRLLLDPPPVPQAEYLVPMPIRVRGSVANAGTDRERVADQIRPSRSGPHVR